MAKKKERGVNVSGKPKHSLVVNRSNGAADKGIRSAGTVRRLKMYNTRPKRDHKGKILKHELQSKDLPSTRIEPDRRWFECHEENSDDEGYGFDGFLEILSECDLGIEEINEEDEAALAVLFGSDAGPQLTLADIIIKKIKEKDLQASSG